MVSTAQIDVTDEALMIRYQRGDVASFSLLVKRHQRPMLNFLLRQSGGGTAAQDLLQELFLRIVENAHLFRQTSRFTTWAYTIARNLCVDHGRKRARRRHAALDDGGTADEGGGAPLVERIADSHPNASTERVAASSEIQGRVVAALEQMPEDQREVFLLRHMVGLPFQEIAVVTGASEGTVKSRMRYALERMQRALTDFEEYARALR